MKAGERYKLKGPMAVKTGLLAFLLAGLLMMVEVWLSIVPLSGFLLTCLAAPFFPRIGFYAPVIYKGISGKKAVAITFDDGPDPLTTPLLLNFLETRGLKATFFVIGENAAANPGLIKKIVQQGHLLGNHSFKHSSRIFFKEIAAVVEDIEATQNVLNRCGVHTSAYRPPVGIVSPRLHPALMRTGMVLINFSCRPLDGGNRYLHNLSNRVLKRIQGDDIVLLHDKQPPDKKLISVWMKAIEEIVDGIEARGMKVIPLSDLIGIPFMTRL